MWNLAHQSGVIQPKFQMNFRLEKNKKKQREVEGQEEILNTNHHYFFFYSPEKKQQLEDSRCKNREGTSCSAVPAGSWRGCVACGSPPPGRRGPRPSEPSPSAALWPRLCSPCPAAFHQAAPSRWRHTAGWREACHRPRGTPRWEVQGYAV